MSFHDPFDTVEDALARRWFAGANFGPMMAVSAGMTAAGGLISAMSTLAGGGAAADIGKAKQAAANYQADQMVSNSAGEIASGSRQSIDIQQKANLLRSTATANAAAGGVVSNAGSALTNQSEIMSRGRNEAALAMWNSENRATGLLNQAAATRTTGQLEAETGQFEKDSSYLNAAATIAGAGGSIFKMYGKTSAPGGGNVTAG
jgi:hypothetical protein